MRTDFSGEITMKTKTLLIVFCTMTLIAAGEECVLGQAAPGVFADANHPSGPPDPQKLDSIWSVDPINDQVSIKIPFPSTPQGGRGPNVPFALLYNSGSTVTLQAEGTFGLGNGAQTTLFAWSAHPLAWIGSLTAPSGPWTTSGPYFYSGYSVVPDLNEPNGNGGTYLAGAGCTIYGPYTYVDEDGASHDLNILGFYSSYTNPSAWAPTCGTAYSESPTYWSSSMTSDGSAMQTSGGGNGGAVTPDGTTAGAGTLTDPNSNSVTLTTSNGVTTATDALGRTVYTTDIPIGQPGQIPANSYYVKTYGESGSVETYNVVFSTEYIEQSNQTFTMSHPTTSEITSAAYCTSCNGNFGVQQPAAGDHFTAVSEIDLPDNASKYQFTYDPKYGTISQITFPTGGYVKFTWNVRDKDWSPYGQFEAISAIVVTGATVSDGSSQDNWTYAMESLSNSSVPIGSVTAPDSSLTNYIGACFVYTLVPFYANEAKATCKEISRAIYVTSGGKLLKTVAQNFTSHGLPIQVATTLYDGPSNLQQLTQYTYDSWDNVISQLESDYYQCSGTPCSAPTQSANLPAPSSGWLRETYKQYAYNATASLGGQSLLNSAFVGAHIVDKPAQVAVTNGSGNPASVTDYQYNSYGNLTTETKCIAPSGTGSSAACGTPYWQDSYAYDTHGQVTSKTEASNVSSVAATTNYTWTGPTGGSGNAYLTTVTYPNNATDVYTYSAYTGQVLSHQDWNTHTTNYDYSDGLNRLRTITGPATTDGTNGANGAQGSGTTTYNYTDTPGEFAVQEEHTVNTLGVNTSATSDFDGLGRKITSKSVTPDCTSPIEVDTVYDSMGRVSTVSNPYCTASDGTYGLTTYSYDALGRKTQVTTPDSVSGSGVTTISYGANATEIIAPYNGTVNPTHIQQVDGLGRLTNVCELTTLTFGTTAPANCNLNVSGTGYLTSYLYDPLNNLVGVTQQSVSRSFTYDPLSRLTYAMNPEAGAVNYIYSTPSAPCSPSSAVPCSKTDARGVKVTYGYDSLSRLTSKTYNDSATPISCYLYDAGSGSNPKGNLVEAWTQAASTVSCHSSLTSYISLKAFSYDQMNRLSSAQTCINGSCSGAGAYQVTMSYDLAGNNTTLTNSVGANSQALTLTHYFDEASRPCLTTSSWTAPASPNIFQVTPGTSTPGYSPAGGLQNYYLGSNNSSASSSCGTGPASPINLSLGYNKRFWVSSINATGQIP
jgi:YD repeat-containing protein